MQMHTGPTREVPYRLRLTVIHAGTKPLTLVSLSAFLYDLLLLHDRLLLLSPKYNYHHDPTWLFYTRKARQRIEEADRLQVLDITRQSPFVVEILLPAAATAIASVWTLVKLLEKIRDWHDDKAIKDLIRRDLELDSQMKELQILNLLALEEGGFGRPDAELARRVTPIAETIAGDAERIAANEQLRLVETEVLEHVQDVEENPR